MPFPRRRHPATTSASDAGSAFGVDGSSLPSNPSQPVVAGEGAQTRFERVFCNRQFFRLWLAQVVSATGDWVGFLAIAAFAARIGAGNAATAVGVVMVARVAPGFFLASVGGVLVDRWDRKKVMVVCDLGRAATMAALPFVKTIWGLVLASLILEVFTLMWSPAKEASVPNLVPEKFLTNANSLSLAAAYGSFPFASALFAFLAKVAQWLAHVPGLHFLRLNQEATGFYFDMLSFCFSAFMISRLAIPHLTKRSASEPSGTVEATEADEVDEGDEGIDWAQAYHEIKEGWQHILRTPLVRAVMIGLSAALLGGGMLVPLGPLFSTQVLKAGTPGFGILTTALGVGVAIGVGSLSVLQKRLPKTRLFELTLPVGGGALIAAAAMSSLALAVIFVAIVGVCAGSVYVVGFTLLQENVSNELRGRVFSAVYTLVRLCILIAFAAGPFLAQGLNSLSKAIFHNRVEVGNVAFSVPGVRWALWLAGAIVLSGWAFVVKSMRRAQRQDVPS